MIASGTKKKRWIAKSQAEVAEFFGVALDTVASWRKKRMPGAPGRYDLAEILTWLRSEGPWRQREESERATTSQDRLRDFQVKTEEAKYLERIGHLLPREHVDIIIDEAMATVGRLTEILRRELSDQTIEDFNAAVLSARSRVYERIANHHPVAGAG